MARLVLKRDTKHLNRVMASFYLFTALATVVNVIYAPLEDQTIVHVLHFITYALFCFSLIFFLIFAKILYSSEMAFNKGKQLTTMAIFILLILILALIPEGITIGVSTSWKPVWSLAFTLYAMAINIPVMVITLNYGYKVLHKFQNPELKKRWNYFLMGMSGNYIVWIGTTLSNYLDNATFRFVWAVIAGVLMIVVSYLIYFGIGKQIQKNKDEK